MQAQSPITLITCVRFFVFSLRVFFQKIQTFSQTHQHVSK